MFRFRKFQNRTKNSGYNEDIDINALGMFDFSFSDLINIAFYFIKWYSQVVKVCVYGVFRIIVD